MLKGLGAFRSVKIRKFIEQGGTMYFVVSSEWSMKKGLISLSKDGFFCIYKYINDSKENSHDIIMTT